MIVPTLLLFEFSENIVKLWVAKWILSMIFLILGIFMMNSLELMSLSNESDVFIFVDDEVVNFVRVHLLTGKSANF